MSDIKSILKIILFVTLAIIAACATLFMVSPGLAFGIAIHGGLPLLMILYPTFLACCGLLILFKITTRIVKNR